MFGHHPAIVGSIILSTHHKYLRIRSIRPSLPVDKMNKHLMYHVFSIRVSIRWRHPDKITSPLACPLSWLLSVFLLLPATQESPGRGFGVLHWNFRCLLISSWKVLSPNFAILYTKYQYVNKNQPPPELFICTSYITWGFNAKKRISRSL